MGFRSQDCLKIAPMLSYRPTEPWTDWPDIERPHAKA